MSEVAEKPSKEFLEYCKGKLFLVDGCYEDNPVDRWVVVGQDVNKIINYYNSLGYKSPHQTEINFSASVYQESPMDVDAVIVLSKTIPHKEIEFLLDETETILYNGASILGCVFNYVKAAIGE